MNAPQSPAALPPPPPTPTRAMIATLGLVAAICGLLIVTAYEGSLPAVKENRRIALERAVAKVLPGAQKTVSYLALADGQVVPGAPDGAPAGALPFQAAYDAQGALMGIAAEGAAKGYADTVRVMFGYKPQCQCIVGIAVVSMRETPGIGDKILTDAAFLKNFEALDVKLGADLKGLANAVKTVKHGTKTDAWQIDAISGATVTSRAVGRGIDEAAQALLPRLVPQLQQIGKAP
ncbi:FMN-binding protein [Rubrivivax gelatinosus]|nr:FMN-binding protein [Rubrivivax gelatinosus]MBG6081975.1 electron transport complex protein RnfG [Rubrivivax gelatinosus]